MHFLYIDEAGNTGANLTAVQQPVFVMASLVVSDEKWRKTTRMVREALEAYFGGNLPPNFELHACELLSPNGEGPFAGHDRENRNGLALELLNLIGDRGHYVFHTPIFKSKLQTLEAPNKDFGFNWHHPWQYAFSMHITMFEEFLRSSSTGATSTGLAIIDHEDGYVEFVRGHTARRQADTGWKQLKKVVEIGYSASSHANPLIQLADLVAFTLKKYYELRTPLSERWPVAAKAFFEDCRSAIWSRVKFKNPSFNKLNVHATMVGHAKNIRKP